MQIEFKTKIVAKLTENLKKKNHKNYKNADECRATIIYANKQFVEFNK